MRTTTVFFTLFAAATLSLTACGGGGDDDGAGDDDSAGAPDANNTEAPDADTTPATKGLGESCTPDAANPTGPGDCGTGMTCLAGVSDAGAYCTKLCTPNDQDPFTECDPYLDGPGVAGCFLTVTDMDNNEIGKFCAIICQAPAQACPDCDNTCPDNYLACTPTDQQGVSACQ
jgi:hypothetical protein